LVFRPRVSCRTRTTFRAAQLRGTERRVQPVGQKDRRTGRRQERRRRLRCGRATSAGRRTDRGAVGRLESRRCVFAGGRGRAGPADPTRDGRGQTVSGDHRHARR